MANATKKESMSTPPRRTRYERKQHKTKQKKKGGARPCARHRKSKTNNSRGLRIPAPLEQTEQCALCPRPRPLPCAPPPETPEMLESLARLMLPPGWQTVAPRGGRRRRQRSARAHRAPPSAQPGPAQGCRGGRGKASAAVAASRTSAQCGQGSGKGGRELDSPPAPGPTPARGGQVRNGGRGTDSAALAASPTSTRAPRAGRGGGGPWHSNALRDCGSVWSGRENKCAVLSLLTAVANHASEHYAAVEAACERHFAHAELLDVGRHDGDTIDELLLPLGLRWTLHVSESAGDARAGRFVEYERCFGDAGGTSLGHAVIVLVGVPHVVALDPLGAALYVDDAYERPALAGTLFVGATVTNSTDSDSNARVSAVQPEQEMLVPDGALQLGMAGVPCALARHGLALHAGAGVRPRVVVPPLPGRTPAEAWCAAAGGPAPRELRFAIGAHAVDRDARLSAAELACAQRVGLRVSVAACGGGGCVSAEAGSGRRTLITGAARVADHQHAPAAPPPAAAAEVPTAAPTPPAAAAHGSPEGSQRGSHSVESPSDARTESEPAESEPDAAKSEPAEARGSIMVRRPSTLLAEPLLGARQGPQIEVVEPAELSTACLELVARLNECASARAVKLTLLHGSFSGAKVLLMSPKRADGRELPTSVLKVDKRAEAENLLVRDPAFRFAAIC